MGPEAEWNRFFPSHLGGQFAPVSPTRAASAHGATLAAKANSSPWRWWTRAWVIDSPPSFRIYRGCKVPLRVARVDSSSPGLNKIPMFIPGRDPCDWVQPGGGQVLRPYWSWQGETFLQMMIQRAWLSAKLVFLCPVRGRFGWRAFQQQLPVFCAFKPARVWRSSLATLQPYNKRLMIVCQPLLIPSLTVWSRISFAPFSQVKCFPDLWLTCASSLLHGPGLLHLQVLPEDRQQAIHIGEERLRDDTEWRVHHHPLRGQLRRSAGAVRLCLHQWPGEQREGLHRW